MISIGQKSIMYAVGETVRVLSKDKTIAYRAIISLCSTNDLYDVILVQCADGQSDEESGVQSDRISPLEKFEKDLKSCDDADVLKGYGNALFTLKDYTAAMEYYKRAISATTPPVSGGFSVGQCVLVSFRDSIDYQSGIISDVALSLCEADVMYDDPATDEELAVPFDLLQRLAEDYKGRLLQRSVYMNMARSALKKEQKGWAIKYSSIAIAIARHVQLTNDENGASAGGAGTSPAEVNKMLADGYYFRAKALLMACRPKFASQDCRSLQQYDATKAAALQKEIQAFREKAAKSNRKLARDIASWVESAMSTPDSALQGGAKGSKGPRGSKGVANADLDILDEYGDGDADDSADGDGGEALAASATQHKNKSKSVTHTGHKSAQATTSRTWSVVLFPWAVALAAALLMLFLR